MIPNLVARREHRLPRSVTEMDDVIIFSHVEANHKRECNLAKRGVEGSTFPRVIFILFCFWKKESCIPYVCGPSRLNVFYNLFYNLPPDNQRTRFRETDLPVPARRVLTLAVCTLDTEEHGRKTSHSPAASEEGALWRVFGRGLRVFDT